MKKDPNEKPRTPEHPDIQRARRDVSDRANEFARAMTVMETANAKVQAATEDTLKTCLEEFERAATVKTVAQRKLADAQAALTRELERPRRA